MMRRQVMMVAAVALAGAAHAQAQAQEVKPPVAAKKPHVVKAPFGAERTDEYYWLRDDTRKNPEMLAHLNAENAYADAQGARLKPLQETLYTEMVGRIRQDDSSVPYRKNGYWYYTRFETGADYPIVARRKGTMEAPEEVLLDQPKMAAGKGYFAASDWAISPDNRLIAWAEDVVGRRQYVLRVKEIATGRMLPDSVVNIEANLIWADDNRTLFYVAKNPTTLRSERIMTHVLGTAAGADREVYAEPDETFYIGVMRTADDRFVCIGQQSTTTAEQRCAPAANPTRFTVLAPRERDILYSADHAGGRWVVRTNRAAKNYKLMAIRDADVARGEASWTPLVPTSDTVFIENFRQFDNYLAIDERADANRRVRILTAAGKSTAVPADEPAYTMALGTNEDPASPWVRYTYGSLVTPETTYEVNAQTGERRVLKVRPVPGYDASKYVTERVWIAARDGVKVPVSLVYAKGLKKDGTAPLFQYAYGSYGASTDPAFNVTLPSLLDRGVVYAIAHIRGGQELGRGWYDDGHLLNKKNSFTDFIDVTRGLAALRYIDGKKVAANGGSAGGLLMGGVANMAPGDYKAIIAQVPFVDVVTTMLDASIPLTTGEYDEWGNPANKPFYDYMLSYSPYDNVAAKAYPAMFVGTGLWDSQVQYYEPAKWVARLRAIKTDTNPLIFRTNMEAGHGGKSGRFQAYRDRAEWMAFTLDQLGVAKP